MDIKTCLTLVLTFALGLETAAAGTVDIDISTGIDRTTGVPLSPLAAEPNYTVLGPGEPYTLQVWKSGYNGLPTGYLGDSAMPGSRWDSVFGPGGAFKVPPGLYDFRTQVDLSGAIPAQALIKNLEVSSDNGFVSVAVNGLTVFARVPSPFAEEFGSVLTIGDVGLGAFSAGLNTIDFTVFNSGYGFGTDPTPSAFRAQADIQAPAAPEPASLLLAMTGALVLIARFRRSS